MEGNYVWPEQPPQKPAPLYNQLLERGREGKNEWWRYCVGIILSFFVGYQIIGAIPLGLLVIRGLVAKTFTMGELLQNSTRMMDPEFMGVSKNAMLASLMFIFVGASLGLWVAVRFVHRKRMMAVISGVSNTFDFKRYFFAFGLWMLICIAQLGVSMLISPGTFQLAFDPAPFFIGVLILLVLLPVQTGWEEVFMRGYIMQGLGLWMKRSLWPWIITSVAFGLLHIMNTEVQSNGVLRMLPLYILPGLIFGAVALMDQRLELPMGMHFANNLFGLLTISSPDSSIHSHTIWHVDSIAGSSLDAVFATIFQLLALVIFFYVYRWDIKKLYK
jgi:membrane protease YdiL (CAAX protease family)